MGKIINWRKATEEEIANGLDHPVNKGMFLVSEEVFEDVPIEATENNINIDSLTTEQLLYLKNKLNNL